MEPVKYYSDNSNGLFTNRMKELRKQSGVSQKEMASDLGVSVSTISNIENGKNCPHNILDWRYYANYLSVSTAYLMGLDRLDELNFERHSWNAPTASF